MLVVSQMSSSFFQILTELEISNQEPLLDSFVVTMDDDDISEIDSPGEFTDQPSMDKQRASLQTYLDSLPYECETVEEMQARLEEIVQKIYICARTKNWLVLSTWDGLLQWYAFLIFLTTSLIFPLKVGYRCVILCKSLLVLSLCVCTMSCVSSLVSSHVFFAAGPTWFLV